MTLSRQTVARLVGVVAVAALLVFSRFALAVSQPPASREQTPTAHQVLHHAPGSILGADSPDLIPDDVAIGQVLTVIASLSASPDSERRLGAYIRHMKAVVAARQQEPLALSAVDVTRIKAIATALSARSRERQATRRILTAEAVVQVRTQLSPEGAELVAAFAEVGVKPNMKLLRKPTVPMSPHVPHRSKAER